MKALKGIFIYTLALIAIIIAVGIIMFGIMFFTNVKLFGYGVVNHNSQTRYMSAETTQVDLPENIEKLEIVTSGFDVKVTPVKAKYLSCVYYDKMFGLYKDSCDVYLKGTEYKEKGVTKYYRAPRYFDENGNEIKYLGEDGYERSVTENAKVVRIEMVEPNGGFIDFRDSRVEVNVPSTTTIEVLDVKTEGGDINVVTDAGDNLNIQGLSITTNDGAVGNLAGIRGSETDSSILEFNTFNIKTGHGTFSLKDRVIVMGTATMRMSHNDPTYIYDVALSSQPIHIESNRGRVEFGDVFGSVEISGNDLSLYANNIYTGGHSIEINAERGVLNVTNIRTVDTENTYDATKDLSKDNRHVYITGVDSSNSSVEIYTTNSSINSDYINGSVSIATTYGNINIKHLVDFADISSDHGNITIDQADSHIVLETIYGNITLNSYKHHAVVNTQYGTVYLKYTGEAHTVDSNGNTEATYVNTRDGNVTLEGISSDLNVKAQDKANVTVTFAKMTSSNAASKYVIRTARGRIVTTIDPTPDCPFSILVSASSVSGEILAHEINQSTTTPYNFNFSEGSDPNSVAHATFDFASSESAIEIRQAVN